MLYLLRHLRKLSCKKNPVNHCQPFLPFIIIVVIIYFSLLLFLVILIKTLAASVLNFIFLIFI